MDITGYLFGVNSQISVIIGVVLNGHSFFYAIIQIYTHAYSPGSFRYPLKAIEPIAPCYAFPIHADFQCQAPYSG